MVTGPANQDETSVAARRHSYRTGGFNAATVLNGKFGGPAIHHESKGPTPTPV
jgi:hypothetical protein